MKFTEKKQSGGKPDESLFGYKLVDRKPKRWVVVLVLLGLALFFGYFYTMVGSVPR